MEGLLFEHDLSENRFTLFGTMLDAKKERDHAGLPARPQATRRAQPSRAQARISSTVTYAEEATEAST
jgi:hypothetical protein